jgi:hypothetical protein|tara:strand:- start:149 stop:574 length:426 start_codon:yes stop_codon:yes gene_type:complete
MKTGTIIAILLFLLGCNKETNQHTEYVTIYSNTSSHKIHIFNQDFFNLEILPNTDNRSSHLVRGYDAGDSPRVNLNMGVVEITYNDTITIKHPGDFYTVKKDIRDPNNYSITKEESELGVAYTHTYTFTDADFMEADSIIN